jgi:hypothetical protein
MCMLEGVGWVTWRDLTVSIAAVALQRGVGCCYRGLVGIGGERMEGRRVDRGQWGVEGGLESGKSRESRARCVDG